MAIDIPSNAFLKLSRAVADLDADAIRKALKKASPDDHAGNANGDSLLMVAIKRGTPVEILRVLVEDGKANVEFKSPRGGTARSTAKAVKRADVLALLDGKSSTARPAAAASGVREPAAQQVAGGDYLVWVSEIEPDGWSLGPLQGVTKDWHLLDGSAYGKTWPKSARFPMKNEGRAGGPRGTIKSKSPSLTDAMHNLDSVLVLSERLAEVAGRMAGREVELLPVKLIDPGGKPVKQRYVIAHPVGEVDAIDRKTSKLSVSANGRVLGIKKLRLDFARIPKARHLFRLAGKGDTFLASRALADAVMALQPTGVRFVEVGAYTA